DEANAINESWMFLTFTSDLSPYLTDSAASRFLIGIIPASRYLIDPDSGTNLTLQAACYHITQSFNRLSQQGVMNLRAFVTGFKGDWKGIKQVLNFRLESMDYACTNLDDSAPFWRTLYTDEPWTIAPAYSGLKGYDLRMVMPDILHVWHLGVGRDLAGSAIVFMIKETDIFQGANQQERLHSATMSLKRFARSQKLPLKLHKLSKTKLGWTGKTFPELKSSGYDTYVTLKWVLQLSHVFSDALPNSLCSCLWTADHVISLLTNGGRYLSEEEQENKEVFGMVFLREYMALANLALSQRPKNESAAVAAD
ncbi:unnamed protein product, partial [Symbiodinium pilosum]